MVLILVFHVYVLYIHARYFKPGRHYNLFLTHKMVVCTLLVPVHLLTHKMVVCTLRVTVHLLTHKMVVCTLLVTVHLTNN